MDGCAQSRKFVGRSMLRPYENLANVEAMGLMLVYGLKTGSEQKETHPSRSRKLGTEKGGRPCGEKRREIPRFARDDTPIVSTKSACRPI